MRRRATALFLAALAACSGSSGTHGSDARPPSDAALDAAPPADAGPDAAPPDAAPVDAPAPDASAPDAVADGALPPATRGCPVVPRGDGDPDLPREFVDTREVAPAGRVVAVRAGDDLQAAIDAARPGDVLELAAGAEFRGNFVLPEKPGEGWIVIRTAGRIPPAGTRVTPADAAAMARITTPNPQPAVRTAARAHHYRFVGIDFGAATGQDVNDLIVLGSGSATTVAELAHHIVIDRCYVHAAAVGGKRGVQLNAAHVGIVDSYISGWRRVGQDTQAVLGWNTPGPFRIVNNYLEGAAENVMFGGADARIPGVIPSDIEFCRNHVSKPRAWRIGDAMYDGTPWSVKNLFELKVGRRVLVAGNVFEQVWPHAQTGFAFVIKTANQDGAQTWATTTDVTIAFNVVRRAAGGAAISNGEGGPTMGTHRVRFVHNAFTEIGTGDFRGNGRLFQVLGVPGVRLDHNTGFGVSHAVIFDSSPNTGFVLTNNVFGETTYGVFGGGRGEGTAALAQYAPGGAVARNVIVGARASAYPSDNFFPADLAAVGFVDAGGGDFALAPASMYRGRATDGRDVGADFTALREATAGVAR